MPRSPFLRIPAGQRPRGRDRFHCRSLPVDQRRAVPRDDPSRGGHCRDIRAFRRGPPICRSCMVARFFARGVRRHRKLRSQVARGFPRRQALLRVDRHFGAARRGNPDDPARADNPQVGYRSRPIDGPEFHTSHIRRMDEISRSGPIEGHASTADHGGSSAVHHGIPAKIDAARRSDTGSPDRSGLDEESRDPSLAVEKAGQPILAGLRLVALCRLASYSMINHIESSATPWRICLILEVPSAAAPGPLSRRWPRASIFRCLSPGPPPRDHRCRYRKSSDSVCGRFRPARA